MATSSPYVSVGSTESGNGGAPSIRFRCARVRTTWMCRTNSSMRQKCRSAMAYSEEDRGYMFTPCNQERSIGAVASALAAATRLRAVERARAASAPPGSIWLPTIAAS